MNSFNNSVIMKRIKKYKFGLLILVLLLILTVSYFIIETYPLNRKEVTFNRWRGSKSLLKEYIDSILNKNEDIEFFNPTRARGQKYAVRVRYKRILSLDFIGGVLVPVNSHSSKVLENLVLSKVIENEYLFKERLADRVHNLERAGVYSIIRTDSFAKVCTTYYDSTYEMLTAVHPQYIEYYESEMKEASLAGKKFVIGFFFFSKKMSSDNLKYLSTSYYLWRLDSSNYYFRVHLPL